MDLCAHSRLRQGKRIGMGMRGDGGLKRKEKLIKTKFISFGFVVVEEFLIKKSAVGVRWKIKKFAAFACSSNLKSVHFSCFGMCVLYFTALAF